MNSHGCAKGDAPLFVARWLSRRQACLCGAAVLVHQGAALGQRTKAWRLCWLSPSDGPGPNHAAFLARMARLGYDDGKQVQIEWAWVGPNTASLPAVAARLVLSQPDLIVAQSQACAQAAQKATSTIPIVFLGVRDAVSAGLVRTYANPGGNLTGVTLTPNDELAAKLLQLLRELMPLAKRVGVFWNPDVRVQASVVELLRDKGKSLEFEVRSLPVHRPGDIERAFEEMGREGIEALLTLVEWFTFNNRALIARLAAEHRIASLYEVKDYVVAGGLMAYGVAYHEHYASAAHYVDKILRGAKPADLPVQQPTKLEMVVNSRTARAIGLSIPKGVLARADEVID